MYLLRHMQFFAHSKLFYSLAATRVMNTSKAAMYLLSQLRILLAWLWRVTCAYCSYGGSLLLYQLLTHCTYSHRGMARLSWYGWVITFNQFDYPISGVQHGNRLRQIMICSTSQQHVPTWSLFITSFPSVCTVDNLTVRGHLYNLPYCSTNVQKNHLLCVICMV